MRLPLAPALLVVLLLAAFPAHAAAPDASAQAMSEAKLACRKASDFKNAAVVGKPVLFSDTSGKTAILVTGVWRPAHMKNVRGTMLCLYDRASRTAETSEATNWAVAAKPAP